MLDDKQIEALTRQAIAGDPEALEQLLLAQYARLHAAVARKIPNDINRVVTAEDILQDVYIEAFRHIANFKPQGEDAIYRWLATIARNRLIDVVKAQRAAKRGGDAHRLTHATPWSQAGVDNLFDRLAFHSSTASRSAVREEAVAAMHVVMASIKQEYRDALAMRYMQGKSVREIADAMGRSEGSVNMLLHRGLRAMQAAMGRASDFFSTRS